MDQISQVVLSLLRSALWGEKISCPADTDWEAVTKELRMQAVLGVVAGTDLPESIPAEVRTRWEGLAMHQGLHFYHLLHDQDELLTLLKENGIPTVILKGMAAAVYYPSPEMRSMGDVDFLVPRGKDEQTYELLLANGYELFEEKDAVDKHISFQKGEARFEMHRYFGRFDRVDAMKYMDDLLQKEMQSIEWRSCSGSSFPMLSSLANGLVLLEHAAGHFRDGLGLRHILDWMMYVHSCLTDAFWNEAFQSAAQAIGLDNFAKVLTKMCQTYLGLAGDLQWCRDADDESCRQIMDYVLEQGNFGFKQMDVEGKVIRLFGRHNGLVEWCRLLQLSGMNHWGAVQRHPILKPFAWIYGIGRYLHLALGRKNAIGLVREEKKKSDQREKMYTELGVNRSKIPVVLQDDQFVERKQ